MHPLRDSLSSCFFQAANLTLDGHFGHQKTCDGSFDLWQKNIEDSVAWIEKDSGGQDLVGIGYSLGAAMLLNQQQKFNSFSKLILIAPAIYIRARYETIMTIASPFRHFGLSAPSKNLEEYRSSGRTHFNSYFGTLKASRTVRDSRKSVSNCLVLCSDKDELLAVNKIRKWCQNNKVEYWPIPTPYNINCNHMIINQAELGEKFWSEK